MVKQAETPGTCAHGHRTMTIGFRHVSTTKTTYTETNDVTSGIHSQCQFVL